MMLWSRGGVVSRRSWKLSDFFCDFCVFLSDFVKFKG